jgi:hypothetical protein
VVDIKGQMNDWQIVRAAIDEDRRMRYPGVREGLYRLTDLTPFRRLGSGVPMLRHRVPDQYDSIKIRCSSDSVFRARLGALAPMLVGLDWKKHGLCLAGGAVSSMLFGASSDQRPSDFDLFLVGHKSDDEARRSIKAVHLLCQQATELCIFRTKGCITFRARNGKPVQVILRRYTTIAEVIHGFDLGASAFLWDGEHVWMTALGKLAANHGANVLNLQARRTSLEARLVKYYNRQFDFLGAEPLKPPKEIGLLTSTEPSVFYVGCRVLNPTGVLGGNLFPPKISFFPDSVPARPKAG